MHAVFFLLSVLLLAHHCPAARTPAFPGAEGAGALAAGGRGGKVVIVTTLDDFHPDNENPVTGSFRYAVETMTGPRIVVFQVAGRIILKTRVRITNPFITIAGQSAPGKGICISHYGVQVRTNDVIIRYLRIRPGDIVGRTENIPFEVDAISIAQGSGNVILDHCSFSWGNDEVCSVSGSGIDKVSVQWCFITESLNNSTHSKGEHGYGSLIRTNGRVSYHHNLWAFHKSRSPRPGTYPSDAPLDSCILFDCTNNLMYKGGSGYTAADSVRMNFINNYHDDTKFKATGSCYYYAEGNVGSFNGGHSVAELWDVNLVPVTVESATSARTRILDSAGAVLPVRDSTDRRVVSLICTQSGGLIDTHDDVGGWEDYPSAAPDQDRDSDGMDDDWEAAFGLDSSDPDDTNLDPDGDGYTNIEEFLNNTNPGGMTAVIGRNSPCVVPRRYNGVSAFRLSGRAMQRKSGSRHAAGCILFMPFTSGTSRILVPGAVDR
jgi:hypothetical protein